MEDSNNESTSSYFLSEGVEAQGEAPEWFKGEKYKTVADQAKAYANLEKMHGELTNKYKAFGDAPESYSVNVPEGININADDPVFQMAQEWSRENNLSQDGFNNLVDLYGQIEASQIKAAEEFAAEQQAQIENFDSRSQNINDYLSANGLDALADLATSKETLEALEKVLDMAGKPSLNPAGETVTAPTEEEINRLMFEKDEFGQVIYNKSAERRQQVQAMIEQRVGKGTFTKVVM